LIIQLVDLSIAGRLLQSRLIFPRGHKEGDEGKGINPQEGVNLTLEGFSKQRFWAPPRGRVIANKWVFPCKIESGFMIGDHAGTRPDSLGSVRRCRSGREKGSFIQSKKLGAECSWKQGFRIAC